jgi:hypothetical protein
LLPPTFCGKLIHREYPIYPHLIPTFPQVFQPKKRMWKTYPHQLKALYRPVYATLRKVSKGEVGESYPLFHIPYYYCFIYFFKIIILRISSKGCGKVDNSWSLSYFCFFLALDTMGGLSRSQFPGCTIAASKKYC